MNRHIVATLALAACVSAQCPAQPGLQVICAYNLPSTDLTTLGGGAFSATDLDQAKANGLRFTDLPSIGSGLACVGENEFVGISDRGPNGVVGSGKDEIRTFPLPKFCPFITRFKLADGKIQILKTIRLRDRHGKPLTGLSNGKGEGRLFASADEKSPLPFDPNGVDPEAIRVFPDGRFLMSEEYGPSVFVVNTTGEVLVRYTPETKPLVGAAYPVKPILPPVLAQRRDNRGFEALALSPDGKTAMVMLQSPAGEEDDKRFKAARVSRAIRLDLSDPLNAKVTGHFLMPLSAPREYGPEQKKASPKLNDAEWLAPNKVLVLEQGKESARLIVADFSQATNLRGRADENTLAFELAGEDLATQPVRPASTLVWASTVGSGIQSTKLEGLAIISPTEIAVANDNDFGLGENSAGESSVVWKVRLSRPLPLAR